MSSRDPRNWMWAEACEFIERAERLHRQFFQLTALPTRQPVWEPPLDMYETADALWVITALPGVPPERLEIRLDSGAIVITGVRPSPVLPRGAVLHRLEIPYGLFERRIELPAGRYDLEQHRLENGCLVLGLRKYA